MCACRVLRPTQACIQRCAYWYYFFTVFPRMCIPISPCHCYCVAVLVCYCVAVLLCCGGTPWRPSSPSARSPFLYQLCPLCCCVTVLPWHALAPFISPRSLLTRSPVLCKRRRVPQPAVTMPDNATVADVCKALANARSDAALLTGTIGVGAGGMAGIVTAIDLTRYALAWTRSSSPFILSPDWKCLFLLFVAAVSCVRVHLFLFTCAVSRAVSWLLCHVLCLAFHACCFMLLCQVSRLAFHACCSIFSMSRFAFAFSCSQAGSCCWHGPRRNLGERGHDSQPDQRSRRRQRNGSAGDHGGQTLQTPSGEGVLHTLLSFRSSHLLTIIFARFLSLSPSLDIFQTQAFVPPLHYGACLHFYREKIEPLLPSSTLI